MIRCLLLVLLVICSATCGQAQVSIVSLEFEKYAISEDVGNLTVVITRVGDTLTPIVLQLEANGVSADPGLDFDLQSALQEIQLLPGETRKEIEFQIIDDQLPEDDEIFTLSLSYLGTEIVTLLLTEANITILNDDIFEIGFEPVSYTADEAMGRVTLIINSTIPNPGPDEIILRIRTMDGTAIVGEDYRSVNDFVIFAPLEQVREYDVEIFDEEKVEINLEMFFIVLEFLQDRERVPGLILGQSTASVFIIDINTVTIQLDPTSVRVNEDFGEIMITIFKEGLSELNVSIQVDTRVDTATEVTDYMPVHQRVIFQPQDREYNVTIQIIGDSVLEDDETFLLELSIPGDEPATLLQPNHITVIHILNDDVVQFHFESEMYFIQENLESATLEIIKEGSNDISVTIVVETQSLEAKAGEDFESIFVMLTFKHGDTNRSVSVPLIDDEIVENLERFFVAASSKQVGVMITSPQRTAVIITNDDSITVGFSQLLYTVGEGVGNISVQIYKRGQNRVSVTVQLSTRDESALEGEDYSEYTEILEIGPSLENETLSVSIPILNDVLAEPTETFTVELLPIGNGVRIETGRSEARVDIIDNDAATIGFAEVSYTVCEEEGARIEINVTKQGLVAGPVNVQYFTLAGQAKDNEDFVPVQPTTVILQEEEAFATVSVEIVNDDTVEGSEVLFVRLALAPDDTSGIQLAADTASVIITDKDVALVGFEMQNIIVQESSGEVTFRVLKTGVAAVQLIVLFTTEDLDAKALLDYIPTTKMITFESNEAEKLIAVDLVDDITSEGNETFVVKLTAVSSNVQIGANAESVVVILDEDVIVVGFEAAEITAEETLGFLAIATVALFQGQAEREFVIGVRILNGTATAPSDFILLTLANWTFTPSTMRVPLIIEIVNDGYAEFTEQVSFELVSYEDNILVQEGNRTLQLTITDQTDFLLGFEVSEVMLHENETLELGIAVLAGAGTEIPFNISYSTASGTAQDGYDYTASMGNLMFAPREQRKVIQVPILNDILLETKKEVFFVQFMVTSSAPGLLEGVSTVTVTITDDDYVVAGFEVVELSVEETTTSEVSFQVVLLQNQADREITIGVQTVNGSAKAFDDYLPISTNLTFEPLQTFTSVSLSIINNEFAEGLEQFSITLISYEEDVRIHDNLLITIADNRDIIFGFNEAVVVTDEANGTVVLHFGLRGGAVRDPFLVQVFTTPLSAKDSSDYTQFFGVYTFSLPDQQLSVEIQIIDDTLLEEKEEQFLVEFSFLSDFVPVLTSQQQATVTILDNDTITVGFEQTDIHVDEGLHQELHVNVVVLQGLAERQFIVDIHAQMGTATASDFFPLSESLTFEPFQTNQTATFITHYDNILELNEQFCLVLVSNDDDVFIQDGKNTLQVTIIDQTDLVIGFDRSEIIVQENDEFAYANLSILAGVAAIQFNVTVTTRDGTAISDLDDDPDFINVTQTVLFSPLVSHWTIAVPIVNDLDLEEKNEHLFVGISYGSLTVLIEQPQVRVTVIDDDLVVVGFQVSELRVEETTSEVVVEVALLQGRSKREFTVGVQTKDGSATGINDYIPISTNLTFEPLQSIGNVSIQIVNDELSEPNEQFIVMLQSYEDAVQLSPENQALTVNIEAQTVVSAPVCRVENSILITPFQDPSSISPQSYSFYGTCEHILLENCLLNPSDFRITIDFVLSNLDIGRVGVKLRTTEIVILEDFSTRLTNLGDPVFESSENSTLKFSDGIFVHRDVDMVVVELQTLGVMLTRSVGLLNLSLTGTGSLRETCGLCGDQFGSLLFSDRTKEAIVSNRSSIGLFANSWRVNPGEQFLRESSKECGFVSNDTVIGDPLFTVPVYDTQGSTPILEKATNSSPPALCFEVHGASNKVFNLVSDRCTTVSALYAPMNIPENGNVIRTVGIRSVDKTGQCVDIIVDLEDGCIPQVSANHSSAIETTRYSSHGVSVSTHQGNRVRVSVPNCENLQLVMWVICEQVNRQEMIKFVITRGINLRPTSHGLLGQFWNIPITFEPLNYTGSDLHLAQEYFDLEQAHTVTVYPPSAPSRSFVGELYWRSWDRRAVRCYYAGNAQGGPVREFEQAPADSVIQGRYSDYEVEHILGTEFTYSTFDEQYCQ